MTVRTEPHNAPGHLSDDTAIVYGHSDLRYNGPNAYEVLVKGASFNHVSCATLDDAENVRVSREYVCREQADIENHETAGRRRKANRARANLYFSRATRIVAAAHELKIARRRYHGKPLPTIGQLVEMMSDDSEVHPCYVERRAKPDKSARFICSYNIIDRARQRLIRLSFGAGVRFLENQAGVPGRGIYHLAQGIKLAFRIASYKYAAELDIRNCFANIDADKVGKMFGMKEDIVFRILTNRQKERSAKLLPRNGRMKHKEYMGHTTGRGLPQGSTASPIFAYGTLTPILEEFLARFGSEVVVFNYCDNFLVLAPTKASMQLAIDALLMLLKQSAEGLTLKEKPDIRRIADGITFAGYRFQRRKGKPIVCLPRAKIDKYRKQLSTRIMRIYQRPDCQKSERETEIQKLVKWIKGQFGSFQLAPNDMFRLMGETKKVMHRLITRTSQVRLVTFPLWRFIEKRCPAELSLQENIWGEKPSKLRTKDRPLLSIASEMIYVPRSFRVGKINIARTGRWDAEPPLTKEAIGRLTRRHSRRSIEEYVSLMNRHRSAPDNRSEANE